MIRKNVMVEWKEFNPGAEKSMKDDFAEGPSPHAAGITAYLHSGDVVLASPSRPLDVFTGRETGCTECIRTDGTFSWPDSLAYYVEEYHLKLPEDFLDRILGS